MLRVMYPDEPFHTIPSDETKEAKKDPFDPHDW